MSRRAARSSQRRPEPLLAPSPSRGAASRGPGQMRSPGSSHKPSAISREAPEITVTIGGDRLALHGTHTRLAERRAPDRTSGGTGWERDAGSMKRGGWASAGRVSAWPCPSDVHPQAQARPHEPPFRAQGGSRSSGL